MSLYPDIAQNYLSFMDQPVIQSFVDNQQGQVFIASELQPQSYIETLFHLGHRHFSEKYVQEAFSKWMTMPDIREACTLHNFGYMQTNKLKKSLTYFDALESVDRLKLIQKITTLSQTYDKLRTRDYYVQLKAEHDVSKKVLHLMSFLILWHDFQSILFQFQD